MGVAVVVFAPYRVLQLLHCAGGCHCSYCAVWGIVVMVVAPHGVLQLLSLHHMGVAVTVVALCGCCGRCLCTAWGSLPMSLHHVGCRSRCTVWGVAITVVALYRALPLLSLRHM